MDAEEIIRDIPCFVRYVTTRYTILINLQSLIYQWSCCALSLYTSQKNVRSSNRVEFLSVNQEEDHWRRGTCLIVIVACEIVARKCSFGFLHETHCVHNLKIVMNVLIVTAQHYHGIFSVPERISLLPSHHSKLYVGVISLFFPSAVSPSSFPRIFYRELCFILDEICSVCQITLIFGDFSDSSSFWSFTDDCETCFWHMCFTVWFLIRTGDVILQIERHGTFVTLYFVQNWFVLLMHGHII